MALGYYSRLQRTQVEPREDGSVSTVCNKSDTRCAPFHNARTLRHEKGPGFTGAFDGSGEAGAPGGPFRYWELWRAAFSSPHVPERGRTSRTPVWVFVQNCRLSFPESVAALTTSPSGSVTFEPAVT
jgi:hypothetical protein